MEKVKLYIFVNASERGKKEQEMFENAVENSMHFTRSIHSVLRNYGSTTIQPINATLFFVNSEGWALTCGHVADNLIAEGVLDKRNQDFLSEFATKPAKMQPGQWKRELEKKYGLAKDKTWEIRNQLVDCVTAANAQYEVIKHSIYDIALLKFKGQIYPNITQFPVFPKDPGNIKLGKNLCRLGFPFPEFSNYGLDASSDKLVWNSTGSGISPYFASEGMVTRFAANAGVICEIELSTPGLKGQSGGPVFDRDGVVWGIQMSTIIMDLDFDVKDFKVYRNGNEKKINAHSMLNLGRASHANVITDFMKANGVKFQTTT